MFLIRGVEGAPLSYDINASLIIKDQLWAKLFTRNFENFGFMAQFVYNGAYRIGYPFETPANDFIESDLSIHDVMLSVDLAIFDNHVLDLR